MSRQHIAAYRTELARLRAHSPGNEGNVSDAFRGLLAAWGRKHDMSVVREHAMAGSARGNPIRVDGAVMSKGYLIPHGFWEAKDLRDRIDDEVRKKLAAGYPDSNIIYENTHTTVLRQNGREVDRAPTHGDDDALIRLLTRFFAYETAAARDFKQAAAKFRADLPEILAALRRALAAAEMGNAGYRAAAAAFLDHAKAAINPAVTAADVREMLIQHILTEEIFTSVFDANFHRENNIAQRLTALEAAFFTGGLRQATVATLKPYYTAIRATAAATDSPRDKQRFIKDLYENFYKVYNPKAADRLGVVYTPGEIVRFMIRGAEWLCEKHFDRTLDASGVEILDPATGTGTFIVELLEHMQGAGRDRLREKYLEELHANEVAILPYYVANLNIEATYAALTDGYEEFPNLCFVDTLDNTAGLGKFAGYSPDLFGSFSDENIGRIKRQNERKISVIIGNPPYNANQQNENDNNKNRTYARIDARIKDTYIKASTAQKTKLYDMYARFFRWASDRLQDEGIVAFITNRSFIDSRTFDGFRKKVAEDFSEGWVIDLGGDFKRSGIAGSGNVFGIGTGVAIGFWIRNRNKTAKTIHYCAAPAGTEQDKLAWLSRLDMAEADWSRLPQRADGAWVDIPTSDTTGMLPIADKRTKAAPTGSQDQAIFKLYSLGVSTNRDDWLYDRSRATLTAKAKHLVAAYAAVPSKAKDFPETLKWSRNLKRRLAQRRREKFTSAQLVSASYRPFSKKWLYQSPLFVDEVGLAGKLFPPGETNIAICFSDLGARSAWCTLAIDGVADLHFGAAIDAYQQVTRYRYLPSGERVDNVTDWAVAQFAARYPDAGVTNDAIFAYVYAALHDPVYRTTYAADLRREFPRILLHDDFARWVAWGQALLDLHIGYETVVPFALTRVDAPSGRPPVPKLKSLPETGVIVLDSDTQLTGVPRAAWDYRLGNRSAIDWVLDQHKEKKIKDPTVARLFDTYRFADHKERVIDLLGRVVAVSLATVAVVAEMRALRRG